MSKPPKIHVSSGEEYIQNCDDKIVVAPWPIQGRGKARPFPSCTTFDCWSDLFITQKLVPDMLSGAQSDGVDATVHPLVWTIGMRS